MGSDTEDEEWEELDGAEVLESCMGVECVCGDMGSEMKEVCVGVDGD